MSNIMHIFYAPQFAHLLRPPIEQQPHRYTQELMSFTENFTYEFRLFSGNVIKLYPDGGFSIDGNTCNGDVYTGVEDCYF